MERGLLRKKESIEEELRCYMSQIGSATCNGGIESKERQKRQIKLLLSAIAMQQVIEIGHTGINIKKHNEALIRLMRNKIKKKADLKEKRRT